MNRPAGVGVIAVLLVLVGVVNVIQGISTMNDISGLWGGLQLITGVAAVACGFGCWTLRSWARVTTIVLMGLNVISLIGVWIQYSDRINVPRLLLPLAINIVIILYLLGPKASAAFRR
ncbi:MAG: hypothetical protein ABIJ48_10820 [Actinomycetota bacterium]